VLETGGESRLNAVGVGEIYDDMITGEVSMGRAARRQVEQDSQTRCTECKVLRK
jgi:hypothetical protein